MKTNQEIKKLINNTIVDLVSDFLFYDRKEDEDLYLDMIEDTVQDGIITIDEIVSKFREELEKGLI